MTFRQFANLDEAMSFMQGQEEAANARVRPDQAAIDYGDHWMQVWENVLIFGYVSPLEQVEADETDLGADPRELGDTLEMITGAHHRGYRYGRAFSIIEPEGEWGSTHVSVMAPITAEQFEAARAHGWDFARLAEDETTHAWLIEALARMVR